MCVLFVNVCVCVCLQKAHRQLGPVIGGVVVGSIVLDKWGDRRDVAGVHSWHAGSTAHRRGLVVQVQHSFVDDGWRGRGH